MDFFENHNADDLQDFAQTAIDFEFLLDDGHEHVNADGDPYLGLDRVLGRAKERLDAQVLLDSFEEELHPPAAFVERRNGDRAKLFVRNTSRFCVSAS